MALKDAFDDFRGTHPFGVVEEPEFDAAGVERLLGQPEQGQVGLAGVRPVVGIDDDVRPDHLQEVGLGVVVPVDSVDVLARQEDGDALQGVHDRRAAFEFLDVGVGVDRDVDVPDLGRPAEEFDVSCVEQVERAADVDGLRGAHDRILKAMYGPALLARVLASWRSISLARAMKRAWVSV